MNIIKVGMADLGIALPPDSIRTSGLGSCVGLTLWDPLLKVAGLAHIMLPSSLHTSSGNPAKYADTAVPMLLELMEKQGVDRKRIRAKMAGGAQMFTFAGQNELMRIGPRNVEAVCQVLQELKIPLLVQETGGNCGRTIELHSQDGVLSIRTAKQGVQTF